MTATPQEKPPEEVPFADWDAPAEEWTLPGECADTAQRTLLLETAARLLFPLVLVFSVYLLIVGHYGPGGGFAGGLTAGLAFVLRYIAGGGIEGAQIGSRIRIRPPMLIGLGLTLAVLTALLPVAFGEPVLASAKTTFGVPLVGQVDLNTNLALDVGVYLLIVGVVLDLLRSLGSGIERDAVYAGDRVEDDR
ncbi:MnhB domain-containing protein [Pseudonocardia endophytica]|uniref:Multisubunit sodium/proton antiporter MrpB subunit n=1 Tax=Pseudonocardia endophytica TaxID=401976 RepID=A0A4R1HVP7_PSEEN|nr:MnhB domain-containing protein [Pseudonocardia endophytica]TCK25501.1 multisubunit sodium/proton antiporter MrpB subunit [Pseudonocardia endophytica]